MDLILILCLSPSDWIAIADIIITVIAGILLGYFIQKNFTINRAVKEYFISENQDIKSKYSLFVDDLYSGKLSSLKIQEWLKIMTIKIDIYEDFLQKEFCINSSLLKNHNEIKYFLTAAEEINAQFNSKEISLRPKNKTEILRLHKEFSVSLTSMVIEINKAKKR